jgi:hypothetical protein
MRILALGLFVCGCMAEDSIGVARQAAGKPDMIAPTPDLTPPPAEDLSAADFAGADLTEPPPEPDLSSPPTPCTTDADCDDQNMCTGDTCDSATGLCMHDAVAGCCTTDTDCGGGSTCQIPRCAIGSHTCGLQTVAGCCAADSECPASECMTATCDVSAHACFQTPISGCVPSTTSGKSGCSCNVGHAGGDDLAALALIFVAAAAFVLRIAARRRS